MKGLPPLPSLPPEATFPKEFVGFQIPLLFHKALLLLLLLLFLLLCLSADERTKRVGLGRGRKRRNKGSSSRITFPSLSSAVRT